MSKESLVMRLRSYLLGLVEEEPISKESLPGWYVKSREVKDFIEKECGEIDVPHFLWHYLEDADIRAKDPRYKAVQLRELKDYIDGLGG